MIRLQSAGEYRPELAKEMEEALQIPPLTAEVLARRGFSSEQADAFLNHTLQNLHDPFLFTDMRPAVNRIRQAIEAREKITVFGDYDADGVTATVLLYTKLKEHNADVSYYIPSRHDEGYGLNTDALRLLHGQGVKLIITVDCGITAVDEALYAKTLGMDLIITDHHQRQQTLPECCAVVCTTRDACYPFQHLCGAGVAAKLVQALFGDDAIEDCLDLIALGTVADVVPLTGENRIFVKYGLKLMNRKLRTGIALLFKEAGFTQKTITASHLSYLIAPRINSAGRMLEPSLAVDMLLHGKDEHAALLEKTNRSRQAEEAQIMAQAEEMLQTYDFVEQKVILLCNENWHVGVIGIVASRLMQKYHRPVLLFNRQDDLCTGSGRSVAGIHLFDMLQPFAHLFEKFGGHSAAVGLTLPYAKLSELHKMLNEACKNVDPLCFLPAVRYDVSLQVAEVHEKLIEDLSVLAPYGKGNPEPVFLFRNVCLTGVRTLKNGAHLKTTLQDGAAELDAIGFRMGQDAEEIDESRCWAAGELAINSYNGWHKPQCILRTYERERQQSAAQQSGFARQQGFIAAMQQGLGIYHQQAGGEEAFLEALEQAQTGVEGIAILCYTPQGEARVSEWLKKQGLFTRFDVRIKKGHAPIPYHVVVLAPGALDTYAAYKNIILVDCPIDFKAQHVVYWNNNDHIKTFSSEFLPDREAVERHYRMIRKAVRLQKITSFAQLADMLKPASCGQLWAAVEILRELGILEHKNSLSIVEGVKNPLENSKIYTMTQALAHEYYGQDC